MYKSFVKTILNTVLSRNGVSFQDWWETNIIYFTWIPRAVLAIIIAIEEEVYARIARWLNDRGMEFCRFIYYEIIPIMKNIFTTFAMIDKLVIFYSPQCTMSKANLVSNIITKKIKLCENMIHYVSV